MGVNSIVNVFQDAVVQVCGTVGGGESLHWRNGKLALFERNSVDGYIPKFKLPDPRRDKSTRNRYYRMAGKFGGN